VLLEYAVELVNNKKRMRWEFSQIPAALELILLKAAPALPQGN
jgi:hypothetical protein